MKHSEVKEWMDKIQQYADEKSGCRKVSVGSAIITTPRINSRVVIYGANITLPVSCRKQGCMRVEKYGDDSKNHRLPSDCRAVHSEITAIAECAKMGISCSKGTILITRYPCEACARAIVAAGIKTVYYGRQQLITDETAKIFEAAKVKVIHVEDWTYEDTTA